MLYDDSKKSNDEHKIFCEICKVKKADIRYVSNNHGVLSEHYLCYECNRQREDEMRNEAFSIGASLFSAITGGLFSSDNGARGAVCRRCGTTSDEFLRSGYVGCGECYKAFEPVMTQTIRRLQHDTSHKGKTPYGENSAVSFEATIENLRRQMNKAVETEDYERAEKLCAEINALKAKLGRPQ